MIYCEDMSPICWYSHERMVNRRFNVLVFELISRGYKHETILSIACKIKRFTYVHKQTRFWTSRHNVYITFVNAFATCYRYICVAARCRGYSQKRTISAVCSICTKLENGTSCCRKRLQKIIKYWIQLFVQTVMSHVVEQQAAEYISFEIVHTRYIVVQSQDKKLSNRTLDALHSTSTYASLWRSLWWAKWLCVPVYLYAYYNMYTDRAAVLLCRSGWDCIIHARRV